MYVLIGTCIAILIGYSYHQIWQIITGVQICQPRPHRCKNLMKHETSKCWAERNHASWMDGWRNVNSRLPIPRPRRPTGSVLQQNRPTLCCACVDVVNHRNYSKNSRQSSHLFSSRILIQVPISFSIRLFVDTCVTISWQIYVTQ